MAMTRILFALLGVLFCLACGETLFVGSDDDAGQDGGAAVDAGQDAGAADAGQDAGAADVGRDAGAADVVQDAGAADSGQDAGAADAGAADAGAVDAGQDAGAADAGQDAGAADAGQDAGAADVVQDAGAVDAGQDAAALDAGRDAGTADASGDSGPERCLPLTGDPALPACPTAGWTEFGASSLLLLDSPSMASAGNDFILELSATGALVQTVLPATAGVLGASEIALDPVSGHLFYTVSHRNLDIYEVRELDTDGSLINTMPMPVTGGGNISLDFDAHGTLYAAYLDHIYTWTSGASQWTVWATLPDNVGIGEIALDRHGNVYLSDPFGCDCVMRFSAGGSHCTLAGPEEGLNSPYGLTVTAQDVVFVTHYDPWGGGLWVDRIDGPGQVSLYADGLAPSGNSMRGLDTDSSGQLYATIEGISKAVIKVNSDGSHEIFQESSIELGHPARIISVQTPYLCQ